MPDSMKKLFLGLAVSLLCALTACISVDSPTDQQGAVESEAPDSPTTFVSTPANGSEPDDLAVQRLLDENSCVPEQEGGEWVRVVEVIDGDTITIERSGSLQKVRYIGVNAPEMDEPSGMDARICNQQMVEDQWVYLLKDVSETDQYGRLLRFVFTSSAFVNDQLVRQGCAVQVTFQPDVSCVDRFRQAERAAREEELGFWQPLAAGDEPAAAIRINDIFYDGQQGSNEPDEYVEIENTGSQAVDLTNWYLKDQGTHRFVFPPLSMEPGQVCRVYTSQDHPEDCSLSFEESSSAIWNNGGDCAFLFTQDGSLVDDFCY